MASTSVNSKKNSKKLKDTLGELESALSSWDQIIPADDSQATTEAAFSGNARTRGAGAGIPEDMKKRTRDLLNQLKEQIDDLDN